MYYFEEYLKSDLRINMVYIHVLTRWLEAESYLYSRLT